MPHNGSLCRRCGEKEPVITARTEPLCMDCFCRYVQTKVVKRMEAFRVRNAGIDGERTLLLPLSLGVCSASLLHMLSQYLRGQVQRTGRTGFKLHVLHIEEHLEVDPQWSSLWQQTRARHPEHTFSSVALSDVVDSDPSIQDLFPRVTAPGTSSQSTRERLYAILSSLRSTTSRTDVIQILRLKLMASFAQQHHCEAVLCADSTTRLAERTLAETAKGRGISLPWMVGDVTLPDRPSFYYPMRDLLSKEIAAFAGLLDPPIQHIEMNRPTTISSKNATIDDLMKQYFESVEREYPSIVANVVKTTAKLQTPSPSQIEQQCELCATPLYARAPPKSRLCYGCLRTLSLDPA